MIKILDPSTDPWVTPLVTGIMSDTVMGEFKKTSQIRALFFGFLSKEGNCAPSRNCLCQGFFNNLPLD